MEVYMKRLTTVLAASSVLVLLFCLGANGREMRGIERSVESVQIMPQKIVFSQERDDYSAEMAEDGFVLKGKLAPGVEWDDLLMPPPWTKGTPVWVEYKWFCKGISDKAKDCFDNCCGVFEFPVLYGPPSDITYAGVGTWDCNLKDVINESVPALVGSLPDENIEQCMKDCDVAYKYECEKDVFVGQVSGKCEPLGDNAGEFVCNINMDDVSFKISDYPQELEQPQQKGFKYFMTPWSHRLIDEDEFDLHVSFRAQYEEQGASTSSFSMRELLKVKPKAINSESSDAMEEAVSEPMQ